MTMMTTTARLGRAGTAAAVCAFMTASAAGAQDGLVIADRSVSAVRTPGADLGPAPPLVTYPLAWGGRLAVTFDAIVDRSSGASRPLLDPVLAVVATRPRIFVNHAGTVSALDVISNQLTPLVPAPGATVLECQYAYSADRVFCLRDAASGDAEFVSVASRGGPLQSHGVADIARSGCFGASCPAAWTVTPEGDRVYYFECTGGCGSFATLAALDVATSTRTRADVSSVPGVIGPNRVSWDEVNQRVFVEATQGVGVLTRDLQLLGTASLVAGIQSSWHKVISPHTGRLYVLQHYDAPGGYYGLLQVFDSTTFAPLTLRLGLTMQTMRRAPTLTSPPGPPRGVAAVVTGNDLSLSWTNVGAASHFVLDVGLAPGRTDLSVYLGPDSHTSFAGVPSGTYDLRLRGGNEFGGGRPSQEIRLVVP
jgi:hypothetical protein